MRFGCQGSTSHKTQICTLHDVTANAKQLFSLNTKMSLQLENRWREDTHHYVRWSDDSREVTPEITGHRAAAPVGRKPAAHIDRSCSGAQGGP